ncbi:MAG: hypothetical protein N3H31_06515 [Candidatus Nezhaarchaeota archaeon]|nr:hypothetical protein [Candidatus Nezhaarchaeota archaeon]
MLEEFLKRGLRGLRGLKDARRALEDYIQLVMAGEVVRDVALIVHAGEDEYRLINKLHNVIFSARDEESSSSDLLKRIGEGMEGGQVRDLLLNELLALRSADLAKRVAEARRQTEGVGD